MKLFYSLLLLVSFYSYSNENLYEIKLAEKTQSSTLIVEGVVTARESFWNPEHTMIYTRNTVQVYSLFKGGFQGQTVTVITEGGRVGDQLVAASSLLELDQNSYGMFFLVKDPSDQSRYRVFSERQGFIVYASDESAAVCPFYETSCNSHRTAVLNLLGVKKPKIKGLRPVTEGARSLGIISFSPQVVTAGTHTELTINGTDFGTTGPSANFYVEFTDANNGTAATYYQPDLTDYVSWTNTQIKVRVPSRAGTGIFRVYVNGVITQSSAPLTVNYSLLTASGQRLRLINSNGTGGSTWRYSYNTSTLQRNAFIRAMDTWKCTSGINWTMGEMTLTTSALSGDGVNLFAVSSALPIGVLGICYNYMSSCNGTDWHVFEQDILFRSSGTWNYNITPPSSFQTDFESVAFHELGHAHLLGHVNDGSDAMYFSLGNGVAKRTPVTYNVFAANHIMSLSTSGSLCSQPVMTADFPAGCSPSASTDAYVTGSASNVTTGACFGPQNVYVSLGNGSQQPISNVEFHWSLNGVMQTPYTWSGNLQNGQVAATVLIGSATINALTSEVKIWAHHVNGAPELIRTNDTLTFTVQASPCLNNDAGISAVQMPNNTLCPGTTDPILITLTNNGIDPLTSCMIYLSQNGVAMDTVHWTGNISPGQSLAGVYAGELPFYNGTYAVSAWTAMPNGSPDHWNANDSIAAFYTPKFCPHNDIGITSMNQLSSALCPGTVPFSVCMTNFGIDPLTACTIHLSVNGTELITYPWSGILAPGSAALCNIDLGSVSLMGLQNNISVYTSLPNGNADERTSNDTLRQLYAPSRLAGTYTIGGLNPDFANVALAATHLNTYGICGDVTFNIRSGTYLNSFFLNAVPSVNGEHTITFQSEAGHADSVILNRTATQGNIYSTLVVNGTKNLVFRNLTFENFATDNFYGGPLTTIVLSGPLKNIRFEKNKIISRSQHPDSPVYGVDIQTGATDLAIGNIVFDGNRFEGGRHAVYCSSYLDTMNGITLKNNRFSDQIMNILVIDRASNVLIRNNYFDKSTGYGGVMQLKNIADTLQVTGNEMIHGIRANTIELFSTSGTAANHSLIANNVIYHNASSDSWFFSMIQADACGYLDFVHNTINQVSTSSGGYVFDLGTGTSNLRLVNNLVKCSDQTYIYRFAAAPGTLNYNNFVYSPGYFGMINGTTVNTLADFQTVAAKDVNSVSIDPGFVGAMLVPTNAAMDNLGTPFAAVSADHVGTLRSTTTPDIGAYEFTKSNYDIGITRIPSPQDVCGDSLELFVSVSNFGIMAVSSFSVQVQINDSVYAPQVFTQSIPADATGNDLYIGTFPIRSGRTNAVTVRTLLPNGMADQFGLNDSLANEAFEGPLSGVYSVGTPASDFPAISDAVTYLNEHGVCGPTVLNIAPGLYIGKHSLEEVPGLSAVNTLLIQSEQEDSMSVTLQYWHQHNSQEQSRYILRLNEVQHVTLKHLKFAPLGGDLGGANGNYDEAVQLREVSHITIRNCHFANGDIKNSISDPNGDQRTFDHVLIRDNYFADGDIVLIDGDTLAIENNIFEIGSVRILYGITTRLEGNRFTSNASAPSNIKFEASLGIQILRNNFRGSKLMVQFCQPINPGAEQEALIANNFFGTTLIMTDFYGFHLVNNSFNISNNYAFSADRPWASVRNNIFSTGTFPPYSFHIAGNQLSGTFVRNAIHSSSPNMAAVGGPPATPISRQNWLGTLNDLNSLYDVYPNYANPAINDLHTNSPEFDGAGVSIPYITNDYDGDPRSISAIDIGADEFLIDSTQFFDIQLFEVLSPDQSNCILADSVKLRIVNRSNFAIDSFKLETISYDYSYGIQPFTVHIPAHDTISLTVGAYRFVPNTGYQLRFILSEPNGEQDDVLNNDSKTVNYTFLDSLTIYERNDPYCGGRELFIDEFPLSSILWSTGSTSDRITVTAPGTYSVTVTGPGGCQVTGTIQIN